MKLPGTLTGTFMLYISRDRVASAVYVSPKLEVIVLKSLGVLAIIGCGISVILLFGPEIFEAAAPTGGRLMKFAVQRHRGVAVAATLLLAGLYAGIAIAGYVQRPIHESAALGSEASESQLPPD